MANLREELAAALPGLQKAVFSQPVDKHSDQKVTVRPVRIKGKLSYQVERFRDNKTFHQNLDDTGLLALVDNELEGRYRQALIVGESESVQYVLRQKGGYKKTGRSASMPRPGGDQAHNREKEYILREGENIPALVDQELAKYAGREIRILDFGCGKSYLTFILYYYFVVKRGIQAKIIGYDLKADVVEHCNQIAQKYGYDGLRFQVADVTRDALSQEPIDMVVTLHACDTATDYALDYAIRRKVKHIFSVPCCQHEVNGSIHKGGQLDLLLNHGIIRERLCALLTDSIRAAVLEAKGYELDMIEFIDFAHSPKNIMLRAGYTGRCRPGSLEQALALQEQYSFNQTLLELQRERL